MPSASIELPYRLGAMAKGRHDVLDSLLTQDDLLYHRMPEHVQEALQETLLKVTDASFDVRIIELLLQYGAKVTEISLTYR